MIVVVAVSDGSDAIGNVTVVVVVVVGGGGDTGCGGCSVPC